MSEHPDTIFIGMFNEYRLYMLTPLGEAMKFVPVDQWERLCAVVRAAIGVAENAPGHLSRTDSAVDALTADDIEAVR
jgi:hypothetical protein